MPCPAEGWRAGQDHVLQLKWNVMSDRIAAVEAYRNGIVKDEDDSVAGYLAGDVVVETNFGRAEGVAAALALLHEPRTAGLLAAGASGRRRRSAGTR